MLENNICVSCKNAEYKANVKIKSLAEEPLEWYMLTIGAPLKNYSIKINHF